MTRIILPLVRDNGALLVSFNGGNMRNAIPREAVAEISIAKSALELAGKHINAIKDAVIDEYSPVEPNIEIFFEEIDAARNVIPSDVALSALRAISACPCNVDRMSLAMENLVETSNNLAIVQTDCCTIKVITLMRGSTDSAKFALEESIRSVFALAGASVIFTGGY